LWFGGNRPNPQETKNLTRFMPGIPTPQPAVTAGKKAPLTGAAWRE
jgi:hypothetical protein